MTKQQKRAAKLKKLMYLRNQAIDKIGCEEYQRKTLELERKGVVNPFTRIRVIAHNLQIF